MRKNNIFVIKKNIQYKTAPRQKHPDVPALELAHLYSKYTSTPIYKIQESYIANVVR